MDQQIIECTSQELLLKLQSCTKQKNKLGIEARLPGAAASA